MTSGGNNTAVGRSALNSINNTQKNTAVGSNAQKSATGSKNVSLGSDSLDQVSGTGNIGVPRRGIIITDGTCGAFSPSPNIAGALLLLGDD